MSKPRHEESLYLKRVQDGFQFASEFDREVAERWGVGSLVRADIHRPRSGRHQRWYRALIRTVWRHQDHFASPDALHRALQWRLGEFNQIVLRNGEIVIDFHSTGFAGMDEGSFKVHVDRCWDVIANEIIPGLDKYAKQELVHEIDKLLLGSL